MNEKFPAISVIIPMYNTEKYIGELLNSLLVQTFKNFEVVIVDNGSTDNSAKIVESYAPNFEGRLKLLKIEKNNGSPSIARNKGLEFSRGEYIFFMDSDDFLIKNALGEMYYLAEKTQVDIVHCTWRYRSEGIGQEFLKNAKLIKSGNAINDLVMMNENFEDKINLYFGGIFPTPPWLKLSRRDFLINNELKFQNIFREDDIWTLQVLFAAKRILINPSAYVIHRMRDDNFTVPINKPPAQYLHYWLDRTVNGLNLLNNFMGKFDFFKNNPNYRYIVLNNWVSNDMRIVLNYCVNMSPNEVYELFKNVFQNDLGENNLLVSCLVANNFILMKNLAIAQQKINDLQHKN